MRISRRKPPTKPPTKLPNETADDTIRHHPPVYEGVDYSNKANRADGGGGAVPLFIDTGKRERKKIASYKEDTFYRQQQAAAVKKRTLVSPPACLPACRPSGLAAEVDEGVGGGGGERPVVYVIRRRFEDEEAGAWPRKIGR